LATPSNYPFNLTNDPLIDVSTHGYAWNVGGSKTINWSISNGFSGEFWNDPTLLIQNLESIFNVFSFYIDVEFNFTGYFDAPNTAYYSGSDINISLDYNDLFKDNYSTWARGFFPDSAHNYQLYLGSPGDIFLNIKSEANYLESYAPGSAGWFLLLHEIGHTLGLKHTHDDGGTGRPTVTDVGLPFLDKDWVSMMSYKDDYDFNRTAFDPSTPMVLDVIGLQYLYGANLSTNSGDNVFALTKLGTYITIWDSSGNDIIDVSASSEGWVINLPEYTSIHSIGNAFLISEINLPSPLNFYWLMGDIEMAVGSQYADTLTGNALNNHLTGNGGNDVIFGGSGLDTAFFGASFSDYTLRNEGSLFIVESLSGSDGIDSLFNIERLNFSDIKVAIDLDGNAGNTAKVLGAVFGAGSITNREYMGIGMGLLDSGLSYEALAEVALTAAGAVTNEAVFQRLYTNVVGSAPTSSEVATYVGLLDNGMSKGALGVIAADHALNVANIDLVGLAQTGIEYV